MRSMAAACPTVKAGRKTRCASCEGTGFRVGDCGASDCPDCGGFGWYVQAGCDGSPPPSQHYEANQPDGAIETASTLEGLLEAMEAFRLGDEDVAVWLRREGRGPRLVAVVKPGVRGNKVINL